MSLVISRLRGAFPGDKMSRTNPFVVLMLGHKRTQTKALRVSINVGATFV